MSGEGGGTSFPWFRGDLRSPWRWLFVAVTLVPVAALTLSPGDEGSVVASFLVCVLCGEEAGANLVRNVVLFIPLGAALAVLLGPGRRAVLVVLAVTATVETLQFHIPGRNPMLADVATNFTGGAVSVWVVRAAPGWLRPSSARGGRLSLVVAAGAAGVMLATAGLFTVDLPRTQYWGQWTPDLAHLERYEGTVLSAAIGGIPAPSRRLDDSARARAALLGGEPVRVEALAGRHPPGVAPIFSVYDEARREVLLLGATGEDLVARVRYRADRFRFERPDLRIPGAFRDVAPGDTIHLELRVAGGSSCLTLDGRTECGMGPRLERGWALLLFPERAPRWFHRLLDFGWMLGLMVPLAFFARGHALSLVGGVFLLGVGLSGWWIAALAPPTGLGVLGMASGLALGGLTGWFVRRQGGYGPGPGTPS